jgi:hypothetical protein
MVGWDSAAVGTTRLCIERAGGEGSDTVVCCSKKGRRRLRRVAGDELATLKAASSLVRGI